RKANARRRTPHKKVAPRQQTLSVHLVHSRQHYSSWSGRSCGPSSSQRCAVSVELASADECFARLLLGLHLLLGFLLLSFLLSLFLSFLLRRLLSLLLQSFLLLSFLLGLFLSFLLGLLLSLLLQSFLLLSL